MADRVQQGQTIITARNERRSLTFEESIHGAQLQALLYAEARVKWLRESSFTDSLSQAFYSLSLSDVIESSDNILAKADKYYVSITYLCAVNNITVWGYCSETA